MDRRRALTSIAAVSGAAVAGSTMVSSSAFAYAAPSNLTPPILGYTVRNRRRIDLALTTPASATCPASATSVTVTVQSWTLSANSLSPPNTFVQGRFQGVPSWANAPTTLTNPAGIFVRKVQSGGSNPDRRWKLNDQISVDIVVRFTCVYAGDTSILDESFPFTLTKPSSDNVLNDWIITS